MVKVLIGNFLCSTVKQFSSQKTGLFGGPIGSPNKNSGGLFGNQGSLFSNPDNNKAQTNTGIFGSQLNKPKAGLFENKEIKSGPFNETKND